MSSNRQPSAFARHLLREELQESIAHHIDTKVEPEASRIFDARTGKPHPTYEEIKGIQHRFRQAYDNDEFDAWKKEAFTKAINDLFEEVKTSNGQQYQIKEDVYAALNHNQYLDNQIQQWGVNNVKKKLLIGYYATFFAHGYYYEQIQDVLTSQEDPGMATRDFMQNDLLSLIKPLDDNNINIAIGIYLKPKRAAVKRFDAGFEPIHLPDMPTDLSAPRTWGKQASPFIADHIESAPAENKKNVSAPLIEQSGITELLDNNPNAIDDSFLNKAPEPYSDILPDDPEFVGFEKQPGFYQRHWWVFAGYAVIAVLTALTIAACFIPGVNAIVAPPLAVATTYIATTILGISMGALATAAVAGIGTAIVGGIAAAIFSIGVGIRALVSAFKGERSAPAPVPAASPRLEGRGNEFIDESLSNKSSPDLSSRTASTSSAGNSPTRTDSPSLVSSTKQRRFSLGDDSTNPKLTSSPSISASKGIKGPGNKKED